MKLPTAVKGYHKIRDSKICSLYATDMWTLDEVAEKFKISTTRVNQIIYKNRALLKIDRDYEKFKRVHTLRKLLKKHPSNMGNKTTIDIVDSMRKEDEADAGSSAVGRSDTRIIIIRADSNQSVEVKDNTIAGMSIIRPAVAAAVEDPSCPKLS